MPLPADLWNALLRYQAVGHPTVLPPPPEPGLPSGTPASVAGGVIPLAADGTPLFDSGLHMYQPTDIGTIKWTNRFRRFLNLQAGLGLQDFPGALLATLLLNQLGPEDYYPDEVLSWGQGLSPQTGAVLSRVQLFNPATSKVFIVIEQLLATRLQTAGLVALIPQNAILGSSLGVVGLRDLRYGQATGNSPAVGNTALVVGHDEAGTTFGATANDCFLASGVASAPTPLPAPILLPPGFGVLLAPATVTGGPLVNEGLVVSVWARERPFPLV